MALIDLIMPKLGESIMEATILKWLKKPGDHVAQDENVLEIATDKVDSEVPSTHAGILEEILYKENDVVPIGKTIAKIKVESEENHIPAARSTPPSPHEYEEANMVEEIPYQPSNRPPSSGNSNAVRYYSPLVLTIASSEGVTM